jgi:hypothetical protein
LALRDHGEFDVFGLLIRRNRSKASWALASWVAPPPVGCRRRCSSCSRPAVVTEPEHVEAFGGSAA